MLFRPADAAEFLAALVAEPAQGPWPTGAPVAEFRRSPAASRTASLAAQSGLFLFHYEHRVALELPEAWLPPGSPELVQGPQWAGGVLAEHKYHSFRHELPIGGFHPGHRAKWSTHELCHGLVGFGWKPGASPLYIATAARLAELVPVLLYYFLDEAHLRRCPAHQGGGALFRTLCPACEASAGMLADDPDALFHLENARRFLDRELAAITRTRRTGVAVAHQWATLDLCSDGLAYAAAHGARLQSATWEAYASRFLPPSAAGCASLDDLEGRVLQVVDGILGGTLAPHTSTPQAGAWLWKLQDVGWRLSTVHSETEGEASVALGVVLDDLAAAVASPAVHAESALVHAAESYERLFEDWELPSPEDVFAVGYTLPRGGHGFGQLAEGVASALPVSTGVLGERLGSRVADWAAEATPSRDRIGTRFACDASLSPVLRELARFEAAVGAVGRPEPELLPLGVEGERFRLARNASVLRFSLDVVDLAEGIDLGDYSWTEDLAPVHGDGTPVTGGPVAIIVGSNAIGETLILDVRPETADRLEDVGPEGIEAFDGELEALLGLGVLVPVRWAE